MDKARVLVLASCPPAIGWMAFHDDADRSLTLLEAAWPVTMGLAACLCGLVSAGMVANWEDRHGGAWSIVGWTALICYAGMLSACMFEQVSMFGFTHDRPPTLITTISILVGMAGMLTGLMTGPMALGAFPVLVATLTYISAR